MTLQEIETRLIELASEHSGVSKGEINHATEMYTSYGLNFDELDRVEFIMDVEDEFEIDIVDDEFEKLKTIGETQEYVHQRMHK